MIQLFCRFYFYLTPLLCCLISYAADPPQQDKQQGVEQGSAELVAFLITPRVIDNFPQGRLKSALYVPDNEDSVYMSVFAFIDWGIVNGSIDSEFVVFDGSGKQIATRTFTVSNSYAVNVIEIQLDLISDDPGNWFFELWQGAELLSEYQVEIVRDYKDLSTYGQRDALVTPYPAVDLGRLTEKVYAQAAYHISIRPDGSIYNFDYYHPTGVEYIDRQITESINQFRFIPNEVYEEVLYQHAFSMELEPAF